jgi:transposase
MDGHPKARRGYSRDQRPDCQQVNIGLVVTPEGLPIAYEVFAGNTADVTTVEDMVAMMEAKYGVAKRSWVMDRGMIREDNLDFLRQRGARYLVGTPKSQLRAFEAALLDEADWTQVQDGIEAKLVAHPDGGEGEQYLLCRSSARREKELAMHLQLTQAEDAFRISKSDLSLRPVFPHKEERVDAHILVCFLSLALWRVLEMWMRGKGPGTCARQLLKEVATVRSMDVVLPVKTAGSPEPREVRLRVVSRPERPVAELLHHLGLELPSTPKFVQNVVEKNGL